MRINTVRFVGLAAVLAGAAGKEAAAADRSIDTAVTTPVATSQPEPPGNVTPGDITVTSTGSITVAAGESAITVDSSNDVSNAGTLSSNDADGTRGIRLLGGNTGNITNSGTISLLESYVLADSDNDGDLDGAWAVGSDRQGILLSSGAFTGDILNSGTINIEGNASSGIRLDGQLVGDLTSTGTISVTGDDSAAVAINGGAAGGVVGDVRVAGSVVVRGAQSAGLLVNAPITGALNLNGTWNVTGYNRSSLSSSITGLEADDLLQSGPAVGVHFSVANGVTVEGIGVEDDEDDDGDGVTEADGDADDDATASINVAGASPALLISADPSADLIIGAGADGFGVHIRGLVSSSGQYSGFNAAALQIEGSASSTVSIANGVAIDNTVRATAFDGDSFGAVIGGGAQVSELLVRGQLISDAVSENLQTAYALDVRAGADLPSVVNSGVLRAQQFGEIGDAVAIRDASNTLASITNSGSILARLIATDADPADGVLPPAPSGNAIAIDLSASSIDVTLNQVADTPFNDDDTTDNDSAARPAVVIEGDVRFGSGADTFNLLAGAMTGDVSFGAGADAFTINNGADFAGRLSDADGQLVLDVQDGDFDHLGGVTNLTSATFGATSVLGITLAADPAQSTVLNASGAVTFAAGSQIDVAVPAGLPVSGSHVFLTAAGGLVGEEQFLNTVLPGTSYLYELRINAVTGDPNSLEAAYDLRTASQLGMNANQAAALDPILAALRLDDDAAAAFAALDSADTFFDAYADLMPSYASAATELVATAIQQSQGAASNRLANTRLHDLDEVSVWAQEIGYGLERTPADASGQEFRGQGFGIAVGIDGPLRNGALFGLGASFLASEADEPDRPQGEISTWLTQANAYLGAAMGPIDLDFVLGAGVGKMRSRRFIEIGSGFAADTEAEWWAYEGHTAVRASAPLAMSDWFIVTPQVALTYVYLNEEGYEESGGGDAFDIEADSATSQRLWADAGVEISARRRLGANGFWAPRIYAGYRANAIDEGAERTFRFAAAGDDFTLVDEPLGDGGTLVGIGLDATNGFSTFSLGYEGELGDQIERHSINAAVRFRF